MIPAHHIPAAEAGAECQRCPLLDCGAGPVPPTVPPDGPIDLLVVAEAPGPIEVEKGETLIGPSGREVRQALADAGADPSRVAYTNAILCRPPGGELENFLRDCKRAGTPSPIECCRPRLLREVSRAKFTIVVGGASVKATGVGNSVMNLRGTPVTLPHGGPGLVTLHPAFVLRDNGRVMRGVFRYDIAKAVRLARGENTWADPPFETPTTAAALAHALEMRVCGDPIAVDTETDGVDAWTCNIRRIGVGSRARVVIYSPLSVDGQWLIPELERRACNRVLAEFFARPLPFVFQNFFGFDSIVLSRHGMPVNETNLFDTLIGHHIGPTSELPHGLDFLGSIYTDAPYWKDLTKHEKRDD